MAWLGEAAAAWWQWWSIGMFLVFAAVESVRPDGRVRSGTLRRWLTHMGCYVASIAGSSAVLPPFLVLVLLRQADDGPLRFFAAVNDWGGPGAVLVLGLLGIDLVGYWAHRLEHSVQMLWRFHAVHHADPDMDVSTTLLHHPIAYLVTAGIIGTSMLALGLPGWVFPVYALFEVAGGAFQHVATPIPDWLERGLCRVLMTPGMHQAHHSDDERHFNCNLGGVLSVWDRMFGTFLLLDAATRERIRFGIGAVPGTSLGQPGTTEHGAWGVLTLPFRMRLGKPASGEAGAAEPFHQA